MIGVRRRSVVGQVRPVEFPAEPARRAAAAGPRAGRWAVGLASIGVGLVLWWALAEVMPRRPTLLPTPGAVAVRLWDLAVKGVLWPHVGVTLAEAMLGFPLAAVVGLALRY